MKPVRVSIPYQLADTLDLVCDLLAYLWDRIGDEYPSLEPRFFQRIESSYIAPRPELPELRQRLKLWRPGVYVDAVLRNVGEPNQTFSAIWMVHEVTLRLRNPAHADDPDETKFASCKMTDTEFRVLTSERINRDLGIKSEPFESESEIARRASVTSRLLGQLRESTLPR